ncbi:MAG TPA: DHH family phosphoesterase [Clostridia bacterium]|nr:DHH family phosphoesterase [Clostridia bacterium]
MTITTDKFDKFKRAIDASNSIAIFCHMNPDGDTLGTGLAMFFALKKANKAVRIFCEDVVPKRLQSLSGAEHIEKYSAGLKDFDLGIAIDCSDIARIGSGAKYFLKISSTIVIDHHKTHENFAKLTIIDSGASATAEIVFHIFEYCGYLDENIAQLLFSALVSDNGCFSYSSTTAYSHEIALKLYSYKFDQSNAIYNIWKKKSLEVFNLSSRVLSKCRFFYDNKVAILTFNKEDFATTGTTQSDTEGIISNVIDIDTVEVAFAISEVGEFYYKVSIRTKNLVDASDCASVFGGGGHLHAAGCRVNGRYEDIIERLVKVATDRLN